jgi:hypothetical protein
MPLYLLTVARFPLLLVRDARSGQTPRPMALRAFYPSLDNKFTNRFECAIPRDFVIQLPVFAITRDYKAAACIHQRFRICRRRLAEPIRLVNNAGCCGF